MPKIEEYNAPEGLGLRPTEVGIESTAGAARRVNAAYNEAAGVTAAAGHMIGSAIATAGEAAVNYIDHQQISQGAAAWAGITNAATQEWNQRNKTSDPNNPSTGQDFLQNYLEPALQKFKGGFLTEKGQDWAEHHIVTLRDHFTHKIDGDMSRKAGEAVVNNHAQALNSLSNAVYTDPSLLPTALGTSKEHIDDLINTSPALKGDSEGIRTQLTQKNKEMLIKSAAMGYIEKTGQMPEWLDPSSPKYNKDYSGYVNAQELKTLQHQAESRMKSFELIQKQQAAFDKQQNVAAVNEAETLNRNNNTEYDPSTNRYAVKPEFFEEAHRIGQMPEGRKAGDAMEAWGKRKQSEKPPPITSDPAVHTDLLERMVTPTDHPTTETEIRLAAAKDQLSDRDTHKLIALNTALTKAPIRDPVMKATLDSVKPLLGNDTVGKQNYAAFLADFIPSYLQMPQAERAGALDFKRADSLVNKVMAPYQRTPQQKMEQHINDKLGITPTPTGPAPSPATPVSVRTPKDAQDLKPGTLYVTPDGQRLIR